MSDTAMRAAILMLVLILPITALMQRRLPVRTVAPYAAAWLIIAAFLYVIAQLFT